ncbi:hypothetical protein BH10BAC2_BH10BAC2_35230 [soil metagenome]
MKTKLLFSFCALLLSILLQQPLQAQAWKLLGNSGTDPVTQFLGTKDNTALVLRTNNIERLRILNTGNVGIGTTSPLQKLDVSGNINMAYGSSLYTQNVRVFTMDIGLFPIRGNLFAGANAGISNTTGIHNTASGYSALLNNTTGSDNTASGYLALYSNLTGSYNTASGSYALYKNTNGFDNTASGYQALYSNTTGYNNTASGYKALYSNTIGYLNTASGSYALYNNTSASYNSAFGYQTLYSNTTGYFNTASGYNALYNNTSAFYNSAFGYQTLYSNTTGDRNTAIGANAGSVPSNLSNTTAIGYNALVGASNNVRVGNTAVTSIGGQVGWSTFSDGRYKKDIKENVQGLVFINSLKPVTYTIDIKGLNEYYDKGRKKLTADKDEKVIAAMQKANERIKAEMDKATEEASKIIYNGFVAQEVEAVAKKINYDFSGVDKPETKDGLYGLRYTDFVVPLVKAVQELSSQNDSLKNENTSLRKDFNDLKNIVLSIQQKQNQCSSCNAVTNNVSQSYTTLSHASSLEHNIPNPFTNTTSIGYTLPNQFTNAKIIITDKNGKTLKTVNISGSGKGSLKIDASTLSAGAYQYSLYIDGRLIDTKQMILVK